MYRAPLEEQLFVLDVTAGMDRIAALPAFSEVTPELISTILEQSGKLASDIFAPTNHVGDVEGATFADGVARVPMAFKEAYRHYADGGWSALSAPAEWGGQYLPLLLNHAVNEQLTSANGTLTGCAQLSWGAVEALASHGTDDQKAKYLPALVSGKWTGTMNLTEPQAGSDVGAIRSMATRNPDGSYNVKANKIFISFGDHDLCENIIHLVLARTPGSPEGSRGLSLFLVPKFHVGEDGSLGEANDVACLSIEKKLGQHGAPTCVMQYGENGRCIGHLLGEEGGGMRAMFTMMNNARINVAVQGVSFAERAAQAAEAYARERVQSRGIGTHKPVAIIDHPDVQRMLVTQRALIEASRALVFYTVGALDEASAGTDDESRAAARTRGDLLTPAAKAYATDMGVEVTSSAIQVFGGLGFIEETGVAQHYRDVRIAPIYEGTNGIQALDFVNRKLGRDGGQACRQLLSELRSQLAEVGRGARPVGLALDEVERNITWVTEKADPFDAAAGATPLLRQFSMAVAGALLAHQSEVAERRLATGEGNPDFLRAKIRTAAFFENQLLPQAIALTASITAGHSALAGKV